jgi:putative chitinase
VLTGEQLRAATGCLLSLGERYAPHLDAAAARFGITQRAAWIAQCAHESARFQRLDEALSYSAPRLVQVWPGRFPTLAAAAPFARNPAALANRVYGGRLGNTQPGDGFAFRGRGLLQLTGRANYTACAAATGLPLTDNPDLLLVPEHAATSAAWFWVWRGCEAPAARGDWAAVSKLVNGGTVGLRERVEATERAISVLA